MARLRHQRVRATPKLTHRSLFKLGGWLQGADSYLWFGERDVSLSDGRVNYGRCYGLLQGQKLYRLAKAIVRHYEQDTE